MKAIYSLVKQLGFDDAQAQLFVEINELGPITVLELSRITNMKRPTVHFHAEQLISRGLVLEGVRAGRRVLTAVSAEAFHKMIERQKEQVTILERSLEKVENEIKNTGTNNQYYGVSFSVEDGFKAVHRAYENGMKSGELFSYIDVSRASDLIESRKKLFDDVALRRQLITFKELFYSRDPGIPEYAKKAKVYKQFAFDRTTIKLQGSIVNILTFDGVVVMILKDTEWKTITFAQGLLSQFVQALIEGSFRN